MYKLYILIVIAGVCLVILPGSLDAQAQPAAGIAGQAASSNKSPGQPVFGLSGSGSGNNGRNFNFGGTAGVGTKVWQSQNGRHSVGVGVAGSQGFGRSQGQSWRSQPSFGGGAAYSYRFGK